MKRRKGAKRESMGGSSTIDARASAHQKEKEGAADAEFQWERQRASVTRNNQQ
jgi:hypothetical protein